MDLGNAIFGFLSIVAGLFLFGLIWNMLKDLLRGPSKLPHATPRFNIETFHKPTAQTRSLYNGVAPQLEDSRRGGVKIRSEKGDPPTGDKPEEAE